MDERQLILVVEDDADIAEAIAAVLEDQGYSVVVVTNGQRALDELRERALRPNLILLDLMMPVMDGRQFRAAQAADPALAAIPVVLLSAHAGLADAAAQMAVAGWLRKPLDLEALLAMVAARQS